MEIWVILVILIVAAAGVYVGMLLSRRGRPSDGHQEVSVIFIPALIIDLAFRLAKQKKPLPLLHSAAEWLHLEYHVPAVVLYPFDQGNMELTSPIVVGPDIPGLPQRIRLGVGIYGEVARNQRSQIVENVARERRLGPTAPGIKAVYILPLVNESTLIGVLSLQSRIPETFRTTERAIFDQIGALIADMAGMALRLEDSRQAISRFDRFQSIAQRLTQRLDSQQLLQEIVEAAREMLDAQAGILLDIDSSTGDLRPIAWAGIPPEVAERIRSRYKEDLKGMVAWARQPARTADLRTDQRSALGSQAASFGMVSELAVPVLHFDKLFGVLAVQTETHRAFTDEEIGLLTSLAAHAGIALRNAQLFGSLQKANRDLEKTVPT